MWGEVGKSGESLFEQAMRELVMSERVIDGREVRTSMVIVDSKSVKNTDLPEEKGYDAGKKNFRDKNTHRRGHQWVSTRNPRDNCKYNRP